MGLQNPSDIASFAIVLLLNATLNKRISNTATWRLAAHKMAFIGELLFFVARLNNKTLISLPLEGATPRKTVVTSVRVCAVNSYAGWEIEAHIINCPMIL
jgi:hypothetical protein